MMARINISMFSSTNSVHKKLKEYNLHVLVLTWVGQQRYEEVTDTKMHLQCTLWWSGTNYEAIPGNLSRLIMYSTGWGVQLVWLRGECSLRLLTSRRKKLWWLVFATVSPFTLQSEEHFAIVLCLTAVGRVSAILKHWVLDIHLGLIHSLSHSLTFPLLPTKEIIFFHTFFSYTWSCHSQVLSWEAMWLERRYGSYSHGGLQECGL